MTIDITQADRDAAADYIAALDHADMPRFAELARKAETKFALSRAFASHRLAERTRCAQIARDQPGKVLGSVRYTEACDDVARAIVKTENNACPTDTGRA